jgi:hypothetical protein
MSIPKFVLTSLLGVSLSIASANAATITNNFVFTDAGNSVVASGSFSYDSAATGTIGYSNLSAFSITLAGESYDLAFINALTPNPDYVYFGYDILANAFVPSSVSGSGGDFFSILAGLEGTSFSEGFFFSPLASQGGSNADGAFTEYRTATDGTAVALAISGVPELSTWLMMILGFAGLAGLAYRRRQDGSLRAPGI